MPKWTPLILLGAMESVSNTENVPKDEQVQLTLKHPSGTIKQAEEDRDQNTENLEPHLRENVPV